ncbi:MAG: DUF6175 family protein [Rikenellaceae bacterium]
MVKLLRRALLLIVVALFASSALAQSYPNIVTLESENDRVAVFTSLGVADKKQDVEENAVKSLFNTLFFIGVDGINGGKPLISNNDERLVATFMANKAMMYGSNRVLVQEATKNSSKKFQGTVKITVPIQNLYKELEQNKMFQPAAASMNKPTSQLIDVDNMAGVTLPSVMVVPYKKMNESYQTIMEGGSNRRIAVSTVQQAFAERDITTVDVIAKLNARNRTALYEASSADSFDKQLLATSGADVYVVVELIEAVADGYAQVTLNLQGYSTASGSVLAAKTFASRKFKTDNINQLCIYALQDNMQDFLNLITKEFNKNATMSNEVVLNVSIAGTSMRTLNDRVGPNNYSISNVVRQWVRVNADQNKFHLQGIVAESIIFDSVMIPLKDADGLPMDAAQFAFLLESHLVETQGVSCTSRVDGATIYITID